MCVHQGCLLPSEQTCFSNAVLSEPITLLGRVVKGSVLRSLFGAATHASACSARMGTIHDTRYTIHDTRYTRRQIDE